MQEPLRLEQKETILHSAEAVLDEAIAFLQGMIRIPTVNPPGEAYPACARYIGERLHSLGYTVEYINLTPAEIAELAPYGAGPAAHQRHRALSRCQCVTSPSF